MPNINFTKDEIVFLDELIQNLLDSEFLERTELASFVAKTLKWNADEIRKQRKADKEFQDGLVQIPPGENAGNRYDYDAIVKVEHLGIGGRYRYSVTGVFKYKERFYYDLKIISAKPVNRHKSKSIVLKMGERDLVPAIKK